MEFLSHSGIYTLRVTQHLPIDLEEAWSFFSNPENLAEITPSHMGFNVTSPRQEKMYEGQIISYKIGILPGIKNNWVTEITKVVDKKMFVDEQRFGPYSMWHHEHHFEENGTGIMMTDKISIKIPFGLFGHLAYRLFIKNQLKSIFSHRITSLERHFSK